jgi:hypothetical protein
MEEQPRNFLPITGKELPAIDVNLLLSDAPDFVIYDFSAAYWKAERAAREAREEVTADLYASLGIVCSFYPNFEDNATPYRPQSMWSDGTRSLAPDDLSEADLDVLSELFTRATNKPLRARLGDILWLRRKSQHAAARTAVGDYLDIADGLLGTDVWVNAPPFYYRALQIANKLGKKNDTYQQAVSRFLAALNHPLAESEGHFVGHLLRPIARTGIGDFETLAAIAHDQAKRAREDGDLPRLRVYLEYEAHFARAFDPARSTAASLDAARTHVEEAEMRTTGNQPSYLAAAHDLAKGVEALRQAGEDKDVVKKLRQRLMEYQGLSIQEFKTVSIPFNPELEALAEKAAAEAAAFVCRENFHEALSAFALRGACVDVAYIEKQVLKNARNNPLLNIVRQTMISREGRVVAHKEGVLSRDSEKAIKALEDEMFAYAAQFHWNTRARIFLEPARQQIWTDHRPRFGDFEFLVNHNPFVPPGHEDIIVRGLYYGLAGDFLLASHLLAPQVENSLRYFLESNGIDVSNLESDLTQPVKTLGALLDMDELKARLGENLIFEIRGMLTHKHGYAFRNNVAHGFVTMGDCFGEAARNVWWLMLRLCFQPWIEQIQKG